jgi:FlaA1/EpsC-like NDP-sugar epimerase
MWVVISRIMNSLGNLPSLPKRCLMVGFDFVAIAIAVALAIVIPLSRADDPASETAALWWLLLVMPLVSIPIFASFKMYRSIIRYLGPKFAITMFAGISTSAFAMAFMGLMWRQYTSNSFSLWSPLLYGLIAAVLIGGSRLTVRGFFRSRSNIEKKPVLIYGAGQAGARLVSALVHGNEFHPVALIDDNPELWKNDIRGVRILSPAKLAETIKRFHISDVLLALPSASRKRRLEIVESLREFPVHVSTIPGLLELVSGSAKFDELRPIRIEDLLGREPVEPDQALLEKCITGKHVLVTGAGGSIGSELCRQIVRQQPKRLIMIDLAEHNLYTIEQSIRSIVDEEGLAVEVTPLLGNVLDEKRMTELVRLYDVQTIYHAAAYKHVPIVEYNLVEGVRNNTLGTMTMARAAVACNVERFVLISTDKAVRPTNAMGATKRMAELVLQGMGGSGTVFSMVRFGNVLDSSGSVVPLFRRQIASGGPVTVTHPDIIRYFMTIPEAAQLVIQAGSLGSGSDVFLLDMGEPVKIVDLARTMIRLAGLDEITDEYPGGDIAIEFNGLRPGEKLYEELLIGNATMDTGHQQILRATEDALPDDVLSAALEDISAAVDAGDCARIMSLLQTHVHEYEPANGLVDFTWAETVAAEAQGDGASVEPVITTSPLPEPKRAQSVDETADSVS